MADLRALKVDAFTTTAYAGNIAGVVPDADGLTAPQMQAIAREMNVSETAFVLPPSRPGADLRLRFFTPSTEIRLCGHATVAAFHALAEDGAVRTGSRVRLETNVGVLDVDVRKGPEVYLSSDALDVTPSPVAREAAAAMLGLPVGSVAPKGEPLLVARETLFVPVAGLPAMRAMKPDAAAIRRDAASMDGVVPVSFETSSPDVLTRIRFFAPGLGIEEDPVTGTAHMGLAAILLAWGRLRLDNGRARFTGEQGHECGRPGRVTVEVDDRPGGLVARVGGRAVTVLRGTMRRPGA